MPKFKTNKRNQKIHKIFDKNLKRMNHKLYLHNLKTIHNRRYNENVKHTYIKEMNILQWEKGGKP